VPRGRPADHAAITGIAATIRELVACRNDGDFARMDALYTDHSFRRAYGHLEELSAQATPGAGMPPGPVAVPMMLETRVLTDSRVGVLLAHDIAGYGLREFLVLARDDGRWLVDEEALVEDPEPGPLPTPTAILAVDATEITIQMRDFAFEPASVTVPAGRPVTIRLINVGAVPHSFAIDALGIDVDLGPRETTTMTIDVPPGVYTFVSEIPGQQAAGMVGTLTVTNPGAASAATPDR